MHILYAMLVEGINVSFLKKLSFTIIFLFTTCNDGILKQFSKEMQFKE